MFTKNAKKVLLAIRLYSKNATTLDEVQNSLSNLQELDLLSVGKQETIFYFSLLDIIIQTKNKKILPIWETFWNHYLLMDYTSIKRALTEENELDYNPIGYIIFSLNTCTSEEEREILSYLFLQHLLLVKYCCKLEISAELEHENHYSMLKMRELHNKVLFLNAPIFLLEAYFKQIITVIEANLNLNNRKPLNDFKINLLFKRRTGVYNIYGQLLNKTISMDKLEFFLDILRKLRDKNWITKEEHASQLLAQENTGHSALHIALMENDFQKIKKVFEEIKYFCSIAQVKEALLYPNLRLKTVIQQAINNGNYKLNNEASIEIAKYFIEIITSPEFFTEDEAIEILEQTRCAHKKQNSTTINELIQQTLMKLNQHKNATMVLCECSLGTP